MSNYAKGHNAEKWLCFYLFFKGYKILAKNFITGRGTGAGEVDIVAKRGKVLCFMEVKLRQDFATAAYAVSEQQKKRIRRGAEAFLQRHKKFAGCDIRFDAILYKNAFSFVHLKNAF